MNDSENAVAGTVAVRTLIRRDFRSKMLCGLGRKPKCVGRRIPGVASTGVNALWS
jgi:hypothetical protein